MGPRVLVVGDVNTDILLTGLDSLPAAETEALARDMHVVVGGQAGTVARALARLGAQVVFVGRVGDDECGRAAVRELSAAGVDTAAVIVDPAVPTGVTAVLSTGAERAYVTYPGALAGLRRADIGDSVIGRADHLHVGSGFLLTGLQAELPGLFLEARRRGITTSLDPGWDPARRWGGWVREALAEVDVFLPNAAEAMAITGTGSPEAALAALCCRTVVIKMGRQGSIARSGPEMVRCAAFRAAVTDVTSAGDVFSAGFLHALLGGMGGGRRGASSAQGGGGLAGVGPAGADLGACLRFAGACGAIAVSRPGSAGIMTGAREVRDFLSARPEEALPVRET
jgi:sugar/nucleoside kinase (ribokinase family)